MTFENCNLFKTSFTTKGIGYTFNNEKEEKLIKYPFRGKEFSPNIKRNPSLMKSASPDHSLKVVIENDKENSKDLSESTNIDGTIRKPQKVLVSIHNPKEPADNIIKPSTSIPIPLGHITTFFFKPEAREIDQSGKELTESQRNCRLDESTESLEIYNVYTRTACLFECKRKYAITKCGCSPWNFPENMLKRVKTFIKI